MAASPSMDNGKRACQLYKQEMSTGPEGLVNPGRHWTESPPLVRGQYGTPSRRLGTGRHRGLSLVQSPVNWASTERPLKGMPFADSPPINGTTIPTRAQ